MRIKKLMAPCAAVLCAAMLASCERLVLDTFETADDEPEHAAESNSVLNVRTRGTVSLEESGSAESPSSGDKVSYPVYVYAFNGKLRCAGMKIVSSADEQVSFKLPEGNYKIYAIGVDDASLYDMPEQSDAVPSSLVEQADGAEHGDLMAASASAALVEDEANTLTLQMSRKVLRLDDVVMENIPDSVTGVKVTVLPLGESLRLDGEVEGTNGSKVVSLVREEGTRTWKNDGSIYLMASGGQATVKVTLSYPNRNMAYSYASEETLEANYIINIKGEFKADEVQLDGTIRGVEWAGTKNLSFQMKEKAGVCIPAVGTLYKGMYVLMHQDSGSQVVASLMSVDEKTGLEFSDDDSQATLKAAVDRGLQELSAGGFSLRLPNKDERDYLYKNYKEVNDNLEALGVTPLSINNDIGPSGLQGESRKDNAYYIRKTSTGDAVYVAFLNGAKTLTNLKYSESEGYRLRGFTSVIFK